MKDKELRRVLQEAKGCLAQKKLVIPEKQKRPGVYEYKKIQEILWLQEKGIDVEELPTLIAKLIDEILAAGPASVYCGTDPATPAGEKAAYMQPMYPFSFYTLEIKSCDKEVYLKFALSKGYFIYLSLHQSVRGRG